MLPITEWVTAEIAHGIAVSGLASSVTFAIAADATPPTMGEVRVGDNAAYWGLSSEVLCRFDAANDTESGIQSYNVSVVENSGVCGGLGGAGYVGKMLSSVAVDCSQASTFSVVLAATFVHGGQYRCVVTATNGAGLSTTRSSSHFIVDLASVELGLGAVRVLDTLSSESATQVSNLTLRVEFETDLDLASSVESAVHAYTYTAGAASHTRAVPLSPVDLFSVSLTRYEPENTTTAANATWQSAVR